MEISNFIDHTLLKANATELNVKKLCNEAKEYGFKTVCVNPYWVNKAKKFLSDSDIGVTTVVGFPLGASQTIAKVDETIHAIEDGADEIDMVMNIGALLSGDYKAVAKDIRLVRNASRGKVLKVILEVAYLNSEQIQKACEICSECKVDFVKTSTGFVTNGNATVDHVVLMKKYVADGVQIKASGGVRSYDDAVALIEAGATRLGTSSGVEIMLKKIGEM